MHSKTITTAVRRHLERDPSNWTGMWDEFIENAISDWHAGHRTGPCPYHDFFETELLKEFKNTLKEEVSKELAPSDLSISEGTMDLLETALEEVDWQQLAEDVRWNRIHEAEMAALRDPRNLERS